MKEKIIIDTDIGDDIDDALALALAISSPEIELVGVTTVYKNTLARARIASWLVNGTGTAIPVVPGKRMPISKKKETLLNLDEIPCQYTVEMETSPIIQSVDAVSFLRTMLTQSPDPITIVTLGALTNIAVLVQRYPEVIPQIKRIVMMGGAYYSHIKEYNICCDPEAADIVFQTGVSVLAVGLDVTLQCKLTEEQIQKLYHSKADMAVFASKLIQLYRMRHHGAEIFLHDPLAVAAVFATSLLEFQQQRILVETEGLVTTGMTFNVSASEWWQNEQISHIQVAKAADKVGLVELFLHRLMGV